MASASNLSIDIRVNVGFTEAILRCASEAVAPNHELERTIALSALHALCELQEMSQAARRRLGLTTADVIELALIVPTQAVEQ